MKPRPPGHMLPYFTPKSVFQIGTTFDIAFRPYTDFLSIVIRITLVGIGTRLTMEQELQLQQDDEEEEEETRENALYTFLRRPAVVYPMVCSTNPPSA